MKNIFKIAITVVAGFFLLSCEREFDKTELLPEAQFTAPTLQSIADVIVDANNNKVEAVTFNWSPASFGAPVQVKYELYLTYGGVDVLGGQSFTNSLTIGKGDLNSLACSSLGVSKNDTAELGAYLVASVYGTEAGTVRSSNTINFNITTFDAPKDCIYLPGHYQGWVADGTAFWEMEGGTKIYRILVALAANDNGYLPFKFYVNGAWQGLNDGWTADWDADFGDPDGNLTVPDNEPINFLTVDVNKKTVTRTAVSQVGLIGSFAESNAWANDVLFAYDPAENVWKTPVVTFTDSDEFLVRLNGSRDAKWKHGDGSVKSSEVEGGYELVNDGEAANIKSPGAGSYIVKLYGNHTPLVIAYEKQ